MNDVLPHLQEALANGAKMDGTGLGFAASKPDGRVFTWLLDNGCPMGWEFWDRFLNTAQEADVVKVAIKISAKGHSVAGAMEFGKVSHNKELSHLTSRLG